MSLQRAAILGFLTGIRSLSVPAMMSQELKDSRRKHLQGTPFAFVESERGAAVLKLMAAGEIVADKLPFVPPRTQTPSIVWRATWGAVMGVTQAGRHDDRTTYALVGAGSAVASTFTAYLVRSTLGQVVPDPLLAIAEDALVIGLTRQIIETR